MTCRADKFFAKKVTGGPEPEWPALHGAVESPEGYHSAREHSDFDDDSEEETQDVESEENLCPNPTIPTLVPSDWAASLSVVNVVQRQIETGKELNGN